VTVVVLTSGTAGATSDVVVVSSSGAVITLADGYTSLEAADIAQVVPSSGQVGTLAEIQGTNMLGGGASFSSITLGGADVDVISDGANDTSIHVVVGAAIIAGFGDVVIVADTGATATLDDGFEYLRRGNVTSVFPPQGQYGTKVSLAGYGLLGGGDTILSVTLAGVEVEEIVSFSDDLIEIIASDGTPGSGYITITADSGAIITTGCVE